MKKFNLEEAKAGKPVCTRDGRDARIVCFDLNQFKYNIIAVIHEDDKTESCQAYTKNGEWVMYGKENKHDLFMKSEKKVGWVCIYKGGSMRLPYCSDIIYETQDEAELYSEVGWIASAKIEWDE